MNTVLSATSRRFFYIEHRMMEATLGPSDFFRQLRNEQNTCHKLVLWGDCLRVRLQSGVCCLPDAALWLCEARKAGKCLEFLSLGAQGRRGTSLRAFFFLFTWC